MIYIYSADGFVREFWEQSKNFKTYKETYESVEKEHIDLFGKRKYSDYNSFRVCRDRKQKETMLHKNKKK